MQSAFEFVLGPPQLDLIGSEPVFWIENCTFLGLQVVNIPLVRDDVSLKFLKSKEKIASLLSLQIHIALQLCFAVGVEPPQFFKRGCTPLPVLCNHRHGRLQRFIEGVKVGKGGSVNRRATILAGSIGVVLILYPHKRTASSLAFDIELTEPQGDS
jgi:hypothetical protein